LGRKKWQRTRCDVSHSGGRTVPARCGRGVSLVSWEGSLVVEPVQGGVTEERSTLKAEPGPAKPGMHFGFEQPASRDVPLPPLTTRPRERAAEMPLHLQLRAPANLRHHVRRAVTRFALLVVADIMTVALMRIVVRALRDHSLLGAGVAGWLRSALPAGYLNGWQFATALFLGLVLADAYGPGDR